MPAPLYQDAISYLRQNGQPIDTAGLNAAMTTLTSNPNLRPSYVQDGGGQAALMANMGVPTDQLPLAGSGVGGFDNASRRGFDSSRLPSDPNILAQANALAAADRQAGGPMPPVNEFADRINGQWMNGGGGDQYIPGAVSGSELPPPGGVPGGVVGMIEPGTPVPDIMRPVPKPAMPRNAPTTAAAPAPSSAVSAIPPAMSPTPANRLPAPVQATPPQTAVNSAVATPEATNAAATGDGAGSGAIPAILAALGGLGLLAAGRGGSRLGGDNLTSGAGMRPRPSAGPTVEGRATSSISAPPKAVSATPKALPAPAKALPAPAVTPAKSTEQSLVDNMSGEKTTTPPAFTPQPPKATEGTTSVNGGPMKTKAEERRKPGATRREKTAQAKQDERSKSRTGVKRAAKRAAVGTAGAGAAGGAASSSEAGEANKGEQEGRKLVAGAKEQLAQLQRTGGSLSEVTAAKAKLRNAEDKAKKWTKAGGRY